MRIYKIVSFPIVILLITMLFAGFVTASAAAQSPATSAANQSVTFAGESSYQAYNSSALSFAATWGAWSNLGGILAPGTGPAVCAQDANSLDVFVVGTDHGLWHKHYQSTSGWGNCESLGGILTSSPAAASPASGKIDVFVRGTDSGLWQVEYNNGGWHSWTSLGGIMYPGTGPAASSWGSGRLDVFVVGTDLGLWHQGYNGAWSGWESLGGILTSSPAAASPASGKIDVFVRGTDSGLWETTYSGGLSPGSTSIYYVPQAGSTWVNHGTAGASYNAYVSTPSLFQTQANGYPYWGDIGKNDFICIPAGSATNNPNVASWEIGFRFSGIASDASATSAHRYQKIWDKAYGGFGFKIDTEYGLTNGNNNYLTIYRATTSGSPKARWYIPTDTPLHVGHNYYIQISWDTSAGPGKEPYPTVWIGEDGNAPVHQTHWDESGGALSGTGSWYDDSVGTATLGSTSSGLACGSSASTNTDWLIGGFFVYRQYNSIVDFSSGGSWSTDKLAWT